MLHSYVGGAAAATSTSRHANLVRILIDHTREAATVGLQLCHTNKAMAMLPGSHKVLLLNGSLASGAPAPPAQQHPHDAPTSATTTASSKDLTQASSIQGSRVELILL
jgi:hypothetical protein